MSKTFERQWKSNATLLTSQGRVQKRESRKKFQHTQEWKATSKDGILKPARSRECSLGASRGKYRQQALKRTNWKIKVVKKLPCRNWSCISKLVEKCKDLFYQSENSTTPGIFKAPKRLIAFSSFSSPFFSSFSSSAHSSSCQRIWLKRRDLGKEISHLYWGWNIPKYSLWKHLRHL